MVEKEIVSKKKIKDLKFLRNAQATKYRSKKTVADGITFASKKEANRYLILKALLKNGEISNLRLQVPFDLSVNGFKVCSYVADFVYAENGIEKVEDVKGMITPVYRLKKKLMKAIHGIEIFET